jgi:hypothetical protein
VPPTSIGAEAIVQIWERGRREHPVDRALTILATLSRQNRGELAAISLEARDAQLFSWRRRLFGDPLSGYAECPRCGCGVDVSLTAAGLEAPPEEAFRVDLGGRWVEVRLPSSLDLAAIATSPSIEEGRRLLLERCAGGPLGEKDGRVVERELEARASTSAVGVDLECPECGAVWNLDLDIAAFLWREIEILAGRLLSDVDTLARRYGWSEAEILGLGAARRRFYLELAS